jgi:acyl-CoA dehydrogenase
MLRGDAIWCQLFSEPDAGSDLAAVRTRADRDGDGWRITGEKVWTSGAAYAAYGYVLCRTNADVPKHAGLTAFVVPMDAAGVTVRPLRQMTGGSSFNTVVFDEVVVDDWYRLGPVDGGWRVAITTLGFERAEAAYPELLQDRAARLRAAARAVPERVDGDALVRQRLAGLAVAGKILELNVARSEAARRAGQTPGPEGSFGKLAFSNSLRDVTEAASAILGARLVADTGEWGTFAWAEHVTGAPGYRIAGGTDEIQRNILGERVLGLPPEPRPGQ